MDAAIDVSTLKITTEILRLIADIDEFKGAWLAIGRIAPERLSRLRRVATIESIGSSTRIEGAMLSDREVERLLSGVGIESFATRDEQEVAGYAGVMETVFESWQAIDLTENHIKQLHRGAEYTYRTVQLSGSTSARRGRRGRHPSRGRPPAPRRMPPARRVPDRRGPHHRCIRSSGPPRQSTPRMISSITFVDKIHPTVFRTCSTGVEYHDVFYVNRSSIKFFAR